MTNLSPKDKAEYLVDKYYEYSQDVGNIRYNSKQCALICCNEIIDSLKKFVDFSDENLTEKEVDIGGEVQFWEYVKSEIENL